MSFDLVVSAGTESYPTGFANKPVSHFLFQCLTVEDFAGKTVEKGSEKTDDLFRASVLAYSFLIDVKYAELFKGNIKKSSGPRALGAAATATGMSMGSQGSGAGYSRVASLGTPGYLSPGGNNHIFNRK